MKRKIVATALALSLLAGTTTVSAASVNTSEFGKFTYSLTKSANKISAKTSTEKTAHKLITKLEIQVNATGQVLANITETAVNAKKNPVVKVINNGEKRSLAAFSAHEARGKSSVVKYKADIF